MSGKYAGTTTDDAHRDYWRTPPSIFNPLNAIFNFELDLAASDSNHLCEFYFSENDNALDKTLIHVIGTGAIWCNPPYSDIMPWVNKCIELSEGRNVVMLIPADTSVKWFAKAFENCCECIFLEGRVSFIHAESGIPKSGNNKGSVLFVFNSSRAGRIVRMIHRDKLSGLLK